MIKKSLLTKKPFARITADGYLDAKVTTQLNDQEVYRDNRKYQILTQSDMMREFAPSGHKINSPEWYHDQTKYDEKTKRFFTQKVVRISFPFQPVIVTQHLVHDCGNPISHRLDKTMTDDAAANLFYDWKMAWVQRNMEIHFYEFVKAYKVTGDAALVYYFDEGKVNARCISFLNDSTLYPHFDPISGKMSSFTRRYYDYDEDGSYVTEWVEHWDNEYLYRFKMEKQGLGSLVAAAKEFFGLEGYKLVSMEKHGFPCCPVAYARNPENTCWDNVQDCIDHYELSFSQFCQNNMAYAFPIMVLKGEEIDIQGDIYGSVKAITMGREDSAEYLRNPSESDNFRLQLEKLSSHILQGSFTVKVPEMKSGDLSGVAIKLIYSPSLERGIVDGKELDYVIDQMQKLFSIGYGIETSRFTQMMNLSFTSSMNPYIHQNTSEMISDLVNSVTGGILSVESAAEQHPYAVNKEIDRILRDKKEEQQYDLLLTASQQKQTDEEQEQEEQEAVNQ